MERVDVPWRGRDAFFVGLIYFLLLGFLLTRGAEEGEVPALLLAAALLQGLVTLGWARLYRSTGKLFGSGFGFTWRTLGAGLLWGALVVLLEVGFAWLVLRLSGAELSDPVDPFQPAVDERSAAIFVVTVVLVVPLAEELFFRGLLLQGLWRSFGPLPAVVVSSVIFGLAHAGGSVVENIISIGSGMLVGAILAWLFVRYRNLALPIAVHATVNAVAAFGLT